MFSAFPVRVVQIVDGTVDQLALVDVESVVRQINVGMLDSPPARGEWVLTHIGSAMQVVDEATSRQAMEGLELMGRPRDADLGSAEHHG